MSGYRVFYVGGFEVGAGGKRQFLPQETVSGRTFSKRGCYLFARDPIIVVESKLELVQEELDKMGVER